MRARWRALLGLALISLADDAVIAAAIVAALLMDMAGD